MVSRVVSAIKEHLKGNALIYLSLFLFYIIGILIGAASVNDLDYQQKEEMVTFFDGFLKLLDGSNYSQFAIFRISLLDNMKLVILFWLLGLTVIGFPMYYIVIGMRGFSTGFSSGILMGVLETKGILISSICFVPKETILVPCLIALGVNGIRLSGNFFKTWLKKDGPMDVGVKRKIMPYSFAAAFFSLFIVAATLIEAFISSGAFKIFKI